MDILLPYCKVNLWLSGLRKIDMLYADTFVNSCAKLVSMLQEHQVKFAPIHMKGIVTINTGLLPFLKAYSDMTISFQTFKAISIDRTSPSRCPGSSVLPGKPCLIHLLKKTNLFKYPC